MDFELGPDQDLLAASLARLIDREYNFATRRKIIAQSPPCSAAFWKSLAEIGLLGLPFAEREGGYGWGAADMTGVMEMLGAALVVEPYLSTVGMCGRLISRAGTPSQRSAFLPQIASGSLRLAFAHTEDARYDLEHVATSARRSAGVWVISGKKCAVHHAPCADKLIVSARHSNAVSDRAGVGVFVVDAHAPGITARRYQTFDDIAAADIELKNVTVEDGALIGGPDDGLDLIDEATDFAMALLASEAVGVIKFAADETVNYLKMRKQFGVPLSSFQVLQHRAVDMMIAHEQARSMAILACVTADTEADPIKRGRIMSAAKIKIAETCRHVRHECVQLHGAIGMTDDVKLSHAFRRLTAIAQQFGDASYHLGRFARLDDQLA